MIILRNKKYAWISKEEINKIICALKTAIKIYDSLVENKNLEFHKEYFSYIHKLKKQELTTELFNDINSWVGSICFGVPEINFDNESDMFNILCPSIVRGSMLEGENHTKYHVAYIDPKYRNRLFISG